jgi:DNA-binding FadR family transcriptional regulator
MGLPRASLWKTSLTVRACIRLGPRCRMPPRAGDIRKLVNPDLRFHLLLCDYSGNRFLGQHARRLLVPLFAFVLMRVYRNQRGLQPWATSLGLHGRVLDVIRLGDPFVAEQVVMRATQSFANVAFDDWLPSSGGHTGYPRYPCAISPAL